MTGEEDEVLQTPINIVANCSILMKKENLIMLKFLNILILPIHSYHVNFGGNVLSTSKTLIQTFD